MERKDFIVKTAVLCGICMIPAVLIESCTKQSFAGPTNVNFNLDLTAASNSALNSTGGYIITNGIIIIRTGSSTFSALSATCTHAGCTVGYNTSNETLICPCHGGTYNSITGAVLAGPPPSALSKYTATRNGNTLTITS